MKVAINLFRITIVQEYRCRRPDGVFSPPPEYLSSVSRVSLGFHALGISQECWVTGAFVREILNEMFELNCLEF